MPDIQLMWYVIQVQSRHEYEIAELCKRKILRPSEDIFVMQGKRFFRNGKIWEQRLEVAFKGYIFVDTENIDDFRVRLRKIPAMTKVLGVEDAMVPVSEEERAFLLRIGGEEHILDLSEGYKEGDKLVVTRGSLLGLEGLVKWTDRHRRTACIEVMLMGEPREILLGVEILKKK